MTKRCQFHAESAIDTSRTHRPSRRESFGARTLIVASVALFGSACGAVAQDDADDAGQPLTEAEGVVVHLQQESTSRNVLAQSLANDAQAAGVDAAMLSSIFGMLTDGAELGLGQAPAQLTEALPANLMLKLRVGGHLAAHEIDRALREARTPQTESTTSTVYIRPDLFKMDADGTVMIWRPAGPAGRAGMWVSDPKTGALTSVDLNQINTFVGERAQHAGIDAQPMPGSPTRELLGHTARGYRYGYTMDLDVGGGGGLAALVGIPIKIQNVVEGTAWIAPDMPEAAQIRAFFDNFASSFGGQSGMLGGLTGGMADLATIGVPLETSQTLRTYLVTSLPNMPERLLVMEGTSTSKVLDITSGVLTDEAVFGPEGAPPESAGTEASGGQQPDGAGPPGTGSEGTVGQVETCDCSCDAFEKLQKKEDAGSVGMAEAMCAPKCMAKWMGCLKR